MINKNPVGAWLAVPWAIRKTDLIPGFVYRGDDRFWIFCVVFGARRAMPLQSSATRIWKLEDERMKRGF